MKIPFWRTVGDAYRFLFVDLFQFFIASGGWLIGLGVTVLAAMGVAFISPVLAFVVMAAGAVFFYLGGTFAFAVSWHRLILRGEPPRLVPRFKRREWRFAGCTALIGLISFAAILGGGGAGAALTFAAVEALGPLGYVFGVLPAIGVILGWWVWARLSLALPATALDEPGGQLRAAWRRGGGNSVRLFFGPLIAALPVAIVEVLLQVMLGPPMWRSEGHIVAMTALQPAGTRLAVSVIDIILYFLEIGLMVGFLSFAFRQITELTELPD